MNHFYDISSNENLPDESLQLRNLGSQRIFMITGGRRKSDYWGTSGTESKYHYTDTVPEDYDEQFVLKINNWKPVYELEKLVDYHYQWFTKDNVSGHDIFLKHMQYVILPKLKKRKDNDTRVELFEQWIKMKEPKKTMSEENQLITNNNIYMGDIHAPIQFQQSSNHSTQTQNNQYGREDIKALFETLSKDIQNVNEQIRDDFSLEMNYALTQLGKNKEVKPQLLNIGLLIKEVGLGTFTNLLASPIFEVIKPHLGL